MRILLVTTHPRPTPGGVNTIKRRTGFPGATFDVLSLHPPSAPLSAVRHVVAEPSVVPWRPLRRLSTRKHPVARPRGIARVVPALLRRARTVWWKLPRPTRWKASPSRMLAVACSTSKIPVEMAREADVVIALEDAACWGVWALSRRAPQATYVSRPGNVSQVLASR